jgi:hypothetical protein
LTARSYSYDWPKFVETTPQPVEIQNALKEVMAAVATPVSVVTTTAEDLPFGTTVSAFHLAVHETADGARLTGVYLRDT